MAKPIIKWVGGKTQLLPELVARLPPDIAQLQYIEPFLGGGALFFHLQPAVAWLNDQNVHLIRTYDAVRLAPEAVITELLLFETRHNAANDTTALYYRTRDIWNAYAIGNTRTGYAQLDRMYNDPIAAATFIYLNKTCFNGIYRVNKDGAFNVPAGKYKHPRVICDAEVIKEASAVLKGAKSTAGDYHKVRPLRPSFLYVDPPYAPTSKTADFVGYTAGGFDQEDQRELQAWLVALGKYGHKWMLSNSSTPEIRKLYNDFKIERVEARRAINSKADKRGAVHEVIITNY